MPTCNRSLTNAQSEAWSWSQQYLQKNTLPTVRQEVPLRHEHLAAHESALGFMWTHCERCTSKRFPTPSSTSLLSTRSPRPDHQSNLNDRNTHLNHSESVDYPSPPNSTHTNSRFPSHHSHPPSPSDEDSGRSAEFDPCTDQDIAMDNDEEIYGGLKIHPRDSRKLMKVAARLFLVASRLLMILGNTNM